MINQSPKLITPIGHTMPVTSVAFSPDGKYILTGSIDNTAKLWNLQGNELLTFEGHTAGVNSVAFSPTHDQIATGSYDNSIIIWDLNSGEEFLRLIPEKEAQKIISIAYTPDGNKILAGGNDGQLILWTIPDKNDTAKASLFEGHTSRVNAVAIDPNSKFIASASSDTQALIFDLKTTKKMILPHESEVRAIAISEDSKKVVTADASGNICVWNVRDGKRIHQFKGHEKSVRAIAIYKDGRVASGSTDHSVVLWEWNNKKDTYVKVKSHEMHGDTVMSVAFSADGEQILSGSENNMAILWNPATDKMVKLKGHSTSLFACAVSPDGMEVLASHTESYAYLWDLNNGELQKSRLKNTEDEEDEKVIRPVAYSKDGSIMLTGSENKTVVLWDAITKEKISEPLKHGTSVKSLAIANDNSLVVCGTTSSSKNLYLWDRKKNAKPILLKEHSKEVRSVAISPDKKYILSGSVDNRVILWDVKKKKVEVELSDHKETIWSVGFSPDGSYFISGSSDKTAILWDTKTQQKVAVLEGHTDDIYSLAFSSDGQRILSGSKDGTAKLWNLKGKPIQTFEGHKSTVSCVQFIPFSPYILTGSHDCTLKIWDLTSGQEIASLIHIGTEDWVVTTPGGLFDASRGAMNLMHYVVGKEVIQLDQLKERYWQPGLLRALFHPSEDVIKDVSAFKDVPLYPEVLSMDINAGQLKVKIKERNGGIGRVSLRINNKERDANINEKGQTEFSVALDKYEKYFAPNNNIISIRCWNEEGWLPGPFEEFNYNGGAKKEQQDEETSLYSLFIGTSVYRNRNLSLSYPDQDATYLNDAVTAVGSLLFKNRVHTKILTTERPSSDQFSSKENIKKAFEEVAEKAKPQDVVVIYFSGHGANYDDGKNAQYYYLTHEIVSSNLSDSAVRQKGTISSEELTGWINQIPAQKQVLIFDTCYSGKIVDSLKSKNAIDATRDRAMERMKDRTGMFVITGSAADKVSYEASTYGQGLLTYSLLMGMKGADLYKGDNQQESSVDVMRWFSYSREKVEQLSREFDVIQRPTLRAPMNVESFEIGIAPEDVRKGIKLAMPKPIFERSSFMNKIDFLDDLDLSESLDQYLAGSIGIGNRPQAIFIDVVNFPGAHYVRGLYEKTNDGHYHVSGRVFQNKKSKGDFEVQGTGMEDIVPLMARRIEEIAFEIDTYQVPTDVQVGVEEKGRKQDLEQLKEDPSFGYDASFIGKEFKVPLPELTTEQKKDIAKSNDNEDILNYQYYSVIQSRSRKLPYIAACNLHGGQFRQISRAGSFIKDPRLGKEHQLDDQFYTFEFKDKEGNPMKFTTFFHRGHMTKREDTQWGKDDEIALRGAKLTFFFTNAIPQHGHLNSVVWRGLEDYIMDVATEDKNAKEDDGFKINIMTGPVFQDDDPKLTIDVKGKKKEVPIPVLFWKIVYFKKKSDDKLYYIGFMMGQKTLLDEAFGFFGIKAKDVTEVAEEKTPFLNYKDKEVYQVKVSFIEEKTKLKFHPAIDPLKDIEGGRQISEVIKKVKKKGLTDEPEGLGYELAGLMI